MSARPTRQNYPHDYDFCHSEEKEYAIVDTQALRGGSIQRGSISNISKPCLIRVRGEFASLIYPLSRRGLPALAEPIIPERRARLQIQQNNP